MNGPRFGRPLAWAAATACLLAPTPVQAQQPAPPSADAAAAPERARKELRDEIYLPSGVAIDKGTRELRTHEPPSMGGRLVAAITPGVSDAKTVERLWLVRAASLERVGDLGRRLAATPEVTTLTEPVDGAYVVRATERAVRPLLEWEEAGWLGGFDWTFKVSPGLKIAVDDAEMGFELRGSQATVAIGDQPVEVESGPRGDPRRALGIPTAEPTLPLEVWLFDAGDRAGFLARLEAALGVERRTMDDGSTRFGEVVVDAASPPPAGGGREGSAHTPAWLRVERLPLGMVQTLAEDLAVARVLAASAPQSLQPAAAAARCAGLEPETVLRRPPGIWPAPDSLDGSGEIIGHADSGLDSGDDTFRRNPDLARGLIAAASLGRPESNDWSDLTGHGTHTAGLLIASGATSGGRYRGVAPGARLVHHSLAAANGVFKLDEKTLIDLLDACYQAGARIHSDSWGLPQGGYDSVSSTLDRWTWNDGEPRDLLVVAAAGNQGRGGRGTIASPADAKNCLAVGAVKTDDPTAVVARSSRGPTVDGRIKPDLAAPGTWLVSTRPYQVPYLVYETMEAGLCCDGWESWPRSSPTGWQATDRAAHDGEASLTDSRDGDYANNVKTILASPKFAAGEATRITFWARWQVDEPAPHGFHILFGDVDRWDGPSARRMPPSNPSWPGWDPITVTVPDYLRLFHESIRIGFELTSDGEDTGDGIYIDDFRVSGWRSDCSMVEADLASADSPEERLYTVSSGTSMATPLVAGLAARYRQFLRQQRGVVEPSAMLLKAALINGAERPAGRTLPDNEIGFGVAGMGLVERAGSLVVEAPAPAPGQPPFALPVDVVSGAEPLRATLVWWDPPGARLANDLDLTLRSPAGAVFPQTADGVNTVEDVAVAAPEPGRWTIEVGAATLPDPGLRFALVVSGDLREVEGG